MKNINEILASGVEEIESGRSTIEQLLEQYEPVRAQLEPLLRIAVSIQKPPPIRPSEEFKKNARAHLMEYIHREQVSRKSRKSVLTIFQMPFLRTGWTRIAAIVLSAILVLTASGLGTAYAAQDSLPGEMLYPVKTFTEDFRVWLETNRAAEATLELEFAGKRLDEMEILAYKAPENLDIALSGYERNLNAAYETIGQITDTDQHYEQLAQFSLAMVGHITVIDAIEDNSDEYYTDTFKQTREITINHHSLVLCSMSQINGVQATEMNIQLMQNRLQRAYNTASQGQKAKAEEALSQYIQLNILSEEILRIAENSGQDTSVIIEMNSEAAQRHRHELGKINGSVSGELKSEANSITGNVIQNQYGNSPTNNTSNKNPINVPVEQDNQNNQQDNQQQPDKQPPEPSIPQQEPNDPQQPDGQGQDTDNGQGGTDNGSGGK